MEIDDINKELAKNGIVFLRDFYDDEKCKIAVSEIDKKLSKLDLSQDKFGDASSVSIYSSDSAREKFCETRFTLSGTPLIQVRGKAGCDTGFLDIWNPEKIFPSLALPSKALANFINKEFKKRVRRLMFNLYVSNGVADTRIFHRDKKFSSNEMFKFFLYLDDVSLEHGPYAYILTSHKNCVCMTDSNKNCVCKSEVFTNETIEYNTYIGSAGDLIISNQAGLHRGLPQKKGYKRYVLVGRAYPS